MRIKEILEEYFECERFTDETTNYELDKGIEKIYFGYVENNLEVVIYQTSTNGYGGPIVTLVGINLTDDKLVNLQVASAENEAVGIGSKVLNHDFSVAGEKTSPIILLKLYRGTVSSNAVKNNLIIAIKHYTENKTLFEKVS